MGSERDGERAEAATRGESRRTIRLENPQRLMNFKQAIGSDPNAIAMRRVVNFYEKLPRGPAPEVKATGILGRYQAKHFGKNPSAKRTYFSRLNEDKPLLSFYFGPCLAEDLVLDVYLVLTIVAAIIHAIIFLVTIGYAQNYYFHLRKSFLFLLKFRAQLAKLRG